MLDILNQSWCGSLIGIIGLIIGIIGIILYRNSKIGARPTCQLKVRRLIGKAEQELPKEVDILYKNRSVPRLTLTKIYLWNAGRETIQGKQIVENDPIRLELEPSDEILKAFVASKTRKVNQVKVEIKSGSHHSAIINFDYLDPNDGVRLDILHTSKLAAPQILGSIRGIPKGISIISTRAKSSFDLVMRRLLRKNDYIMWITLILGLFIITLGILPKDLIKEIFLKTKETSETETTTGLKIGLIIVGLVYTLMPTVELLRSRKRYPDCLDNDEKKT